MLLITHDVAVVRRIARGFEDLATRYGDQRFRTEVTVAVVAVLRVLVCAQQWDCDRPVARLDQRR